MSNPAKLKRNSQSVSSTPKPKKKKKVSPVISPASCNIRVPSGHLIVSDKYNDGHGIVQLLKGKTLI